MNLIKKIEINYFRSIYRINLKKLRPLNIISGRNDAGKSNILKALNLFFNNHTDWQRDLLFYRDFSYKRLNQVRKESVKGKQYISIAIEFLRPPNFAKSLPESFIVKRTWHRESKIFTETNNLDALDKTKHLPNTIEVARRFLGNLMHRIHFEYVPAVKDRAYFEHLLARLQETLLDIPTDAHSDISKIAENLAKHIQTKIIKLEEDFLRATNIKSHIEPPNEFAALFRSFAVSTKSGEDRIPLALRGDGIQARFVSSVLQYISDNSKDFIIWGFEEPENSLEYSHLLNLVKDFSAIYSQKSQIFISTHSPAFTSLRNENNTCYRVHLKDGQSELNPVWPETADQYQHSKLNIEMGFMKLQEHLHEEYVRQRDQLEKIQSKLSEFENDAKDAQKALVITEGKTDKKILDIAWGKLHKRKKAPFIIRATDPTGGTTSGGAGGIDMLAKTIETIHPDDKRKAIAIFDRDKDGIRAFRNLSKNFKSWQKRKDVKHHSNGIAFALLLPAPKSRKPYVDNENFQIEFMFADSFINRRTADGKGLVIQQPTIAEVTANRRKIKVKLDQTNIILPDGLQMIINGKDAFAFGIVPNLSGDAFKSFNKLFVTIKAILK